METGVTLTFVDLAAASRAKGENPTANKYWLAPGNPAANDFRGPSIKLRSSPNSGAQTPTRGLIDSGKPI